VADQELTGDKKRLYMESLALPSGCQAFYFDVHYLNVVGFDVAPTRYNRTLGEPETLISWFCPMNDFIGFYNSLARFDSFCSRPLPKSEID